MLLKNFLKSHSVFHHLPDRDLDALAHAFMIREYGDGQTIIKEGKSGKELYLLVEGQVKVAHYHPLKGSLEDLKLLHPGELFGLLSLVDHLPSAASCIAVGPVKVGVLPRTGYNLLAQSAAPIALGFQLAVAHQLAADLRHRDETLRSMLA
jgi:CRP-like cAMP-binding protein